MQFTLATCGVLHRLEAWHPQPHVRVDLNDRINRFRYICYRTVSHRVTQACWCVAVALSTLLCLAVQPLYDMGTITNAVLFAVQVFLLTFFWVRMLLHIAACGVVGRRNSFFRSFWNWVELAVNVFGILQVIPTTNGIRWMRAVSAARPLSLLFLYSPIARLAVVPAAQHFPQLFDVGVVFGLSWVCLASIGCLVLRDSVESRCYVTALWQSGSAFDSATLPVLLTDGAAPSALCGVGRPCVSPSPGVVEVACLARSSTAAELNAIGLRGDVRDVAYFFSFRNLGTALLATLRAGSADALPEELERWMVLRGSGAALFPVAIVLVVSAACASLLATFSAAYGAYKQQQCVDEAGPDPSLSAAPASAPKAVTEINWPGDAVAPGSVSADVVTLTASRRDVDDVFDGGTITAVGTQTAPMDYNSFMDELSCSRRDHDDTHSHTHVGNPLSPADDDHSCGPFVLSCVEERSPRTAKDSLTHHFFDTWQLFGFTKALRRQLQSVHGRQSHGLARVARIIESPFFAAVHLSLLVANVVLLAVHEDPFTSRSGRALMQASSAVALFLFVHAVLSVLAYGPQRFVCHGWNVVGVCGGVTGVLELAVPSIFRHYVVRGIRVLRVMPLIHFTSILSLVPETWPPLLHVGLASVAVIALYTLVGMQLFADFSLHASSLSSGWRADYRTVWLGLLSTFVSATGDGWSVAMLAVFQGGRVAPAVLYYLSLLFWRVVLADVVLVAILAKALHKRLLTEAAAVASGTHPLPPLLLLPPVQESLRAQRQKVDTVTTKCPKDTNDNAWQSPFAPLPEAPTHHHEGPHQHCLGEVNDKKDSSLLPAHTHRLQTHGALGWRPWLERPSLRALQSLLPANAFFVIPSRTVVRSGLVRVFYSWIYHVVASLAVVIGVVALFFERAPPQRQSTRVDRALFVINIVYVVFFWLEMVCRCLAYGLLWRDGAESARPVHRPSEQKGKWGSAGDSPPVPYLRHPLNWLDVGANALAMGGIFYAPLRVGRVLRTARLVTSTERPNRAFAAAMGSLLACVRVVPFIVVLHVVFALLGLQFFSGRLHHCSEARLVDEAACINAGALWLSPRFMYNNFGDALLSVLAVSTTHHWSPYMVEGTGVGASDSTPQGTRSGYYVVFFLGVIVILRFLTRAIVMAFLTAQYTLRRRYTDVTAITETLSVAAAADAEGRGSHGPSTLPPSQALRLALRIPPEAVSCGATECWVGAEFVALLAPDRCPPLRNRISRACHKALSFRMPALSGEQARRHALGHARSVFEWTCFALTVVVCAFVAASFAHPSPRVESVFFAFDCVAVVTMGVEIAARLVAYGFQHLRRPWYIVDMALFALYVVAMCVTSLTFFRSLLFVRLVRMSGLSMSLYPLVRRVRPLLNAAFVYVALLLVFSVVATQLFGGLHLDGQTLTEKQNFRTVIGSVLMLFTCSTSSNWAELVAACAQDPRTTQCGRHQNDSCGKAHEAIAFFVVFACVMHMFVVPLCFVSLVETCTEPSGGVSSDIFFHLQRLWRGLTPNHDLSPLALLACLPFLHQATESSAENALRKDGDWRRHSHGGEVHSHVAVLARLRLTVDREDCVTYTQAVTALLHRQLGVLRSELSWFTSAGAPSVDPSAEVAAKALTRLCERERQSRSTAEWRVGEGDSLLARGPRRPSPVRGVLVEALDGMDTEDDTHTSGRRLRGPDLVVPKKTQPLPGSALFLFNVD